VENIKIKLNYRSQNNNGWPLIMIKINEAVVARFEADCTEWADEFDMVLNSVNTLKIEHFGKNYLTDHTPDKFFELQKVFINEVDLKHHVYLVKQTAFLPPWDSVGPPDHSFYLGHNGFLSLEFTSPVNQWIQRLFNIDNKTMHGQQTTVEVLEQVKNYFELN